MSHQQRGDTPPLLCLGLQLGMGDTRLLVKCAWEHPKHLFGALSPPGSMVMLSFHLSKHLPITQCLSTCSAPSHPLDPPATGAGPPWAQHKDFRRCLLSKTRAVRDELLSLAGSPQPSAPALDQPRCREAPADSHPAAAAGNALG